LPRRIGEKRPTEKQNHPWDVFFKSPLRKDLKTLGFLYYLGY